MKLLKSIHKFRIPINGKQIRLAFKRYGVRKLPNLVYERLYDIWFDKKYGTNTVSVARLEDLDVGEQGQRVGNQYQPSGLLTAKNVLMWLQINGFEHLVDFGSGKGQVLLQADRMLFKTIHGIEFSGELHQIAKENIRAYYQKVGSKQVAKSFHGDASEYIVSKTMNAFYFFNPFKPFVLEKVLENIETSVEEHPRSVIAAYLYPIYKHVFTSRPKWKVVHTVRISDYECILYTYESNK